MQITKAEVTPIVLTLRQPVRVAGSQEINRITAVFVRLDTKKGRSAWGCTVAHPELTGEKPEDVIRGCRDAATVACDLHPTNIEYSLAELAQHTQAVPSVMCAFDLAFYDLLSLSADMPLYRILGGYRNRIQTSITVPLASPSDTAEMAANRANQGFRILKIKGGADPDEDVQRMQAVRRALPDHTLRLDADGGYTVQQAVDVARALEGVIEMLEQPVGAEDLEGLREVKKISPVPVLADQSVRGPESALELASGKMVDGMSVKMVSCGGITCGRQVDAIARAARIATMVGCFIEPALLVSAGLSLALSSPNVRYSDLDGCFDLNNDPSKAGFRLEEGWLVAADVPGLGYSVEL